MHLWKVFRSTYVTKGDPLTHCAANVLDLMPNLKIRHSPEKWRCAVSAVLTQLLKRPRDRVVLLSWVSTGTRGVHRVVTAGKHSSLCPKMGGSKQSPFTRLKIPLACAVPNAWPHKAANDVGAATRHCARASES